MLLIKPIEKAYNGLKEAEESLEEEMKCKILEMKEELEEELSSMKRSE